MAFNCVSRFILVPWRPLFWKLPLTHFTGKQRLCTSHASNFSVRLTRNNGTIIGRFMKHYSTQSCSDSVWTIREVVVKSKTKLRPDGTLFRITFADSVGQTDQSVDRGVIIGVHGTPGSMGDLISLLSPFVTKGYRVIVPDLPGFGQSVELGEEGELDQYYSQRVVERADLMLNFLNTLNIDRSLSLLVTHSSGVYVATHLVAQHPDVTKALMLITPGIVFQSPIRLFPPWLVELLLNTWDNNPSLRQTLTSIGSWYSRMVALPHKSMDDLKRSGRVLIGIDFKRMTASASQIGASFLPITYVYCDGDPIIQTNVSRRNAAIYRVRYRNTDIYDAKANLIKKGLEQSPSDYKKGIVFTRRTHFPPKHDDLRQILNGEMESLMEAADNSDT